MTHDRPQTTQGTVPTTQLPALYHQWKWRILVVYASFYLFQYVGRFHLSQVAALVMQDLAIDHHTLGWITALLYWGFMAGDLVHGRLGEMYGLRLWALLGALLTTACNWLASLSVSAVTLAILWCINGFVNAACWRPGISLLAQWWPRRERGQALGIVGMAAGVAMLVMWLVSGWVGEQFGWRAAFRYPPLLIALTGVIYYPRVQGRPRKSGLRGNAKVAIRRRIPEPTGASICTVLALINVCSRTR